MLTFADRHTERKTDESAGDRQASYGASRPSSNNLNSEPSATPTVGEPRQANLALADIDDLGNELPLFQKLGSRLVYLHGYNDTPVACFERCDRLQSLYGLEVVRFSWSSRKHLIDDGVPAAWGLKKELAQLAITQNAPHFSDELLTSAEKLEERAQAQCAWWLVMALP